MRTYQLSKTHILSFLLMGLWLLASQVPTTFAFGKSASPNIANPPVITSISLTSGSDISATTTFTINGSSFNGLQDVLIGSCSVSVRRQTDTTIEITLGSCFDYIMESKTATPSFTLTVLTNITSPDDSNQYTLNFDLCAPQSPELTKNRMNTLSFTCPDPDSGPIYTGGGG